MTSLFRKSHKYSKSWNLTLLFGVGLLFILCGINTIPSQTQEVSNQKVLDTPNSQPVASRGGFSENYPIQKAHVTEFNSSGPVNPDYNQSIIYQYGYSEVGAFYSVWGNSTLEWDQYHTKGFNFSLPEEYYPYWNLSYVNYFNISSTLKPELDEYFLTSNEMLVPVDYDVDFAEAGKFYIEEIKTKYSLVDGMYLHFSELDLNPGDILRIYNESIDWDNPLYEITGETHDVNSIAPGGLTNWINGSSTYIVINSSTTDITHFRVNELLLNGTALWHDGTSEYLIDKNIVPRLDGEDTISFKVTIQNLNLTHGARFYISDPEGYNVTEIWTEPDPSPLGTGSNYTMGMDFQTEMWINPNYVGFNASSAPVNQSLCNYSISFIQYNVTQGWAHYYLPFDNPGDFITYEPFTRNVTIDFTKLLGCTEFDPKIKTAYSSWTFIFNKTKWDTNLTIHDYSSNIPIYGPQIVHSGGLYNFSFNLTDSIYHYPVDWFTFEGWEDNLVRLDIWQGKNYLFTNTTGLHGGFANITVDFGTIEGNEIIHAGDLQLILQVNDTNHVALDNTSARVVWRIAYYEQPGLTLNKIYSENIPETTSLEVSTPAGVNYDRNKIYFNISAYDIYGDTGPMNGQPFNVTIMWEDTHQFNTTIHQSFNASDGANYTLFEYSFDKIGKWNITFTMENSSGGYIPLGYYLPTSAITINVTVTPRPFTLDVYDGSEGVLAGQKSLIFGNVTDLEEIDVLGDHYPLWGWRTDFYYLWLTGNQYEKVFIRTAFTNTSGISMIEWIPPKILAGETIFLLIEAYTPNEKLLQYVPSSSLLKKGFDVEKLNPSFQVIPHRDPSFFDENLVFDVILQDELHQNLLGSNVAVELSAGTTVVNFDLRIGRNNTGVVCSAFAPYVGEVDVELSYTGSFAYNPASLATSLEYSKVPCEIDVDVDPTGYTFNTGVTLPIDVWIQDVRNGSTFNDTGVLKLQLFDKEKVEIHSEIHTLTVSTRSNKTFGWAVPYNGLFYINVSYYGGIYHAGANYSDSFFVKRAEVHLEMEDIFITAGQDLEIEGQLSYAVNGSLITGVLVAFEFKDIMGNMYLLGFNYSDNSGISRFNYAYDPSDYLYQYMVEFGGEISMTSRSSLQLESGFDYMEDFKIGKCPTEIVIDVTPSTTNEVLISIDFNTFGYASPKGEVLYVEIWSLEGFDYRTLELRIQEGEKLAFYHELEAEGDYYIRVVYKGSHTFQANAAIEIFNKEKGVLSRPQSQIVKSTIQMRPANPGNPLFTTLLQLLVILIPLTAILIGQSFLGPENRKKILALALIFLFLIQGLYYTFMINCSTPGSNDYISDFLVDSQSQFSWVENENLPAEELESIGDMMNLEEAMANVDEYEMFDEYYKDVPDLSNGETNLSSLFDAILPGQAVTGDIPTAAAGEEVTQDVSLGTFGLMPYPIGDVLNISFSTKQDSSYFIVVTDTNLDKRVYSIFGTSPRNEPQNVMIPIDENHFKVGGKYALELAVYKYGVTEYLAREQRRMTFAVIRGFSKIDVNMPSVEIDQERSFVATLTEEYSGKPIANQLLEVSVMDNQTGFFDFFARGYTNEKGQLSVKYPINDKQQTVTVHLSYPGDASHFGYENNSAYEILPITTYLNMDVSPTQFTDSGKIAAVLYDQYGNLLEGKDVEFLVHLYNTTWGIYSISDIEDTWINIGQNKTDSSGIADTYYTATFPKGSYYVCARFNGDDRYAKSWETSQKLEVFKEKLEVTFWETDLTYGDLGALSVNLTDDEGNPAAYNAVNFSAYVDHEWHFLGTANTSGDGSARIMYTPYFNEGVYPLKISKWENDRYEVAVEFGEMTVRVANTYLDVGGNVSEYLDEICLSAVLTFQNGTNIDPVIGEALLFYLFQEMPDGSIQFPYIGYGVTDENGTASLVWQVKDRLPGRYLLKVFFPGNKYADSITSIEECVEITKAQVKIATSAPGTVSVIDYADFVFNITNQYNETVWGETLRITVANLTDPTQVAVCQDIITDIEGFAYFRWCPPNPGNYTVTAELVSDYYTAPTVACIITVARKAVMFNATISNVRFYRGDVCTIDGNATIKYTAYNGSTIILPATSVPLRFYIWNETNFIHPVSGFRVPNMPLYDIDYGVTTIYTQDNPRQGQFYFRFIMPDQFYGLQAGHYYVKIKVDTTKTGLYEGEGYLGFDLVEHTSLSVWIDPSENVTLAQQNALPWSRKPILNTWDYFVEERELVHAQLQDQDNVGLIEWLGPNATSIHTVNRDLIFNMGHDGNLYFHVDINNNPSIYRGTIINAAQNLTSLLQPQFDINSGHYTFYYWPYNPGTYNIIVTYAGDRFFDQNSASLQRTVFRRITYVDTDVSHVEDLYRASTPQPSSGNWKPLQTWTRINTTVTDALNGTRISNRQIQYMFDSMSVEANFTNMQAAPRFTDANGQTDYVWDFDDIQSGMHYLYIITPETRVWQKVYSDQHNRTHMPWELELPSQSMNPFSWIRRFRTPYWMQFWETTQIEVSYNGQQISRIGLSKTVENHYIVKVKDQDNSYINEANYSWVIWGPVDHETAIGGKGRQGKGSQVTAGQRGLISWDIGGDHMAGGTYQLLVDFLGYRDGTRNYRASSYIDQDLADMEGSSGFKDILEYDSRLGSVDDWPFAVRITGTSSHEGTYDNYHNIQEARKELGESVEEGRVEVNCYDGFGWLDARQAVYVWHINQEDLHYYPNYESKLSVILAFSSQETAEYYMDEVNGASIDFIKARLMWPDAVWPLADIPFTGSPAATFSQSGDDPCPLVESNYNKLQDFFSTEMMEVISQIGPSVASADFGSSPSEPSASAQGAFEFFNVLADTSRDNFCRGLYTFLFRFIAYASTGFMEKTGDSYAEVPESISHTHYNASMLFENTPGSYYPSLPEMNIEVPDLPTWTVYSPLGTSGLSVSRTSIAQAVSVGNYALAIAAGTSQTPGEQAIITYTDRAEFARLSDCHTMTFYLTYKPNKQNKDFDDQQYGINITLVDTQDRRVTYTKTFSTNEFNEIYGGTSIAGQYGDHIPVSIDLRDFVGHREFRLSNIQSIIFETVDDGFLDEPGEVLYIDQVEFHYSIWSWEEVVIPGQWVQYDPVDWWLRNFFANLFLAPLWGAFVFAVGKMLGIPWFKDVFTWKLFMSFVDAIILGSGGSKSPFDCIMDIITILCGNFYNVFRGRTFSRNMGGEDSFKFKVTSEKPDIKGFLRFMGAGYLSLLFNNVPTYFLQMDDVWDLSTNTQTSIFAIAKKGWPESGQVKEALKWEAIYFIWVFLAGTLMYVAVKVNNKFVTAIMDNLVTIGFDMFFLTYEAMMKKNKGGNGFDALDPAAMIVTAAINFLVFMLVDIVIDLLIVFLRDILPAILIFILDKIVRLIAKIVILAFLYPGEIGTIWPRVILTILVVTVLMWVIIPIVAACIGKVDASNTTYIGDGWEVGVKRGDGEPPHR